MSKAQQESEVTGSRKEKCRVVGYVALFTTYHARPVLPKRQSPSKGCDVPVPAISRPERSAVAVKDRRRRYIIHHHLSQKAIHVHYFSCFVVGDNGASVPRNQRGFVFLEAGAVVYPTSHGNSIIAIQQRTNASAAGTTATHRNAPYTLPRADQPQVEDTKVRDT